MMSISATILALDLSTPCGRIAVLRGDEVLFRADFQSERSHNAQVFAPLGQALKMIPADFPTVVVVGIGPGSYTGVRISIAAAQGVALARRWPIVGWPSIASAPDDDYQVLGDARRGQFYHARVKNGRLLQPPILVPEDQARSLVEDGGTWVTFDACPPLSLRSVRCLTPDAVILGRHITGLSEAELNQISSQPLEPFYLQEAFITTARKAGKSVPQH